MGDEMQVKHNPIDQIQKRWQDKTRTHQWLRSAGLRDETKHFILAAKGTNAC